MKKAPKVQQFASHGPKVLEQVRMASTVMELAGPTYDERFNELLALVSTVQMDEGSRKRMIDLMNLLYTIRLNHLLAEKLVRDVVRLTVKNAPEIVRGVQRIKGGRNTGQTKTADAATAHAPWIVQAKKLIANGTDRRRVSTILASRYSVTSKTIRTVLQAAGVLPIRQGQSDEV